MRTIWGLAAGIAALLPAAGAAQGPLINQGQRPIPDVRIRPPLPPAPARPLPPPRAGTSWEAPVADESFERRDGGREFLPGGVGGPAPEDDYGGDADVYGLTEPDFYDDLDREAREADWEERFNRRGERDIAYDRDYPYDAPYGGRAYGYMPGYVPGYVPSYTVIETVVTTTEPSVTRRVVREDRRAGSGRRYVAPRRATKLVRRRARR